ncbi:MAG TPA: trypsin-like peptidase domain-containing protein [Allocoleopsis sp.]
MADTKKWQEQKDKVDRFVARFGNEAYRQLVCHAALPLVLTPELVNYLRNEFLRGEDVPWEAEVDLLLSDLCSQVGYELYAMDTQVRAYLLEEIQDSPFWQQRMREVAQVLISYVNFLSRINPEQRRQELEAQRLAAMVYLGDETCQQAVQEIAERFKHVSDVAEGRELSERGVRAELARLSRITQELAPQLKKTPSLIEFAKLVQRVLRNPEAVDSAELQQVHQVGEITLKVQGFWIGTELTGSVVQVEGFPPLQVLEFETGQLVEQNSAFPMLQTQTVESVTLLFEPESALSEDELQPVVPMSYQDVEELVQILSNQAAFAPSSPRAFFENMLLRANLPEGFCWEVIGALTDTPPIDARNIVRWAISKGTNPIDPRSTVLGSLLEVVLRSVGLETSSRIMTLITNYNLYRDPTLLAGLPLHSGSRSSETSTTSHIVSLSPDFTWRGPTDQEELQALLKQLRASPLDVGFLQQSIHQTASICRIELSNSTNSFGRIIGNGFLIGPRLLLTNYHVLDFIIGSDLRDSISNIVLRFGYLISSDVRSMQEKTFRLSASSPILCHSSTEDLDFALLQVEEDILAAEYLHPAPVNYEPPATETRITLFNYPEEQTMRISLNLNGITEVFDQEGLIQYFSDSEGAMSGSPCFNDRWEVVALHHAQKAASSGIYCEGILLRAIYPQIKNYLNN